jgi:hypothetical protein
MSLKVKPMEERFWAMVNKTEGCWEWTGSTNSRGYGLIRAPRRGPLLFAHRYSAMLVHGMLSRKELVLHHCDNRKCINPEHLYIGTPQQNMDDMHSRGRWRKRGPNRDSSNRLDTHEDGFQ